MKWRFFFTLTFCFKLVGLIPEKVLICVIFDNAGPYLSEVVSDVENIGSLFQDYRVIAYENNSDDDTPSKLYRWKRENPKIFVNVEFLSKTETSNLIVNSIEENPSILEQWAKKRNKVLKIAQFQFGEEFSYIIWLDSKKTLESVEGIIEAFQLSECWDAVFAYGMDQEGNFDDWFAFRDKDHPFGPELLGDAWYEEDKHFSLSKSDSWHPVYSAFGGCAIYKRSAFQNCKYEALVTHSLEEVTRNWFFQGLAQNSPSVHRYLKELETIRNFFYIEVPNSDLPEIAKSNSGVYISKEPLWIVWRMHGLSNRYPETCDHLSLHASMHCNGYHRFFINPRINCIPRRVEKSKIT